MGECLIVRKGSTPEGTATASDVLSGKTFQSANSDDLQTGSIKVHKVSDASKPYAKKIEHVQSYLRIAVEQGYYEDGASSDIDITDFGNASANDVLNGKTFTSSAGLKVSGTYNPLISIGFINVPNGNWVFKATSTGSTFPGFSDNVIPMAMDTGSSCSRSHSNYTSSSAMTTSGSTAINGKTASAINASASKGINRESLSVSANTTAYSVFLPWFYNMDLSAVQNGVTSGTITAWLEKQ